MNLRYSLLSIKSRIVIPKAWSIKMVREGDTAIMDEIIMYYGPSEHELALVNSVQLYLIVIIVADL